MIDFKHFNSLIQVTDYFTDNDTCKQAKIARQMAQGNGVYDKSKGGWQ